MSRIGRLPVDIPTGVQVELTGSKVHVKGPKGELHREFSKLIDIKMEDNQLKIARASDNPEERALHGTTRAVLANMIHGVSKGFQVAVSYTHLSMWSALLARSVLQFTPPSPAF